VAKGHSLTLPTHLRNSSTVLQVFYSVPWLSIYYNILDVASQNKTRITRVLFVQSKFKLRFLNLFN
jgi:hypothetical protein